MILIQRDLWIIQVSFYYKQVLIFAFNMKTDETKIRGYTTEKDAIDFIDSLVEKLPP